MPKRKNNKPKSLYIHIPFCSHICEYCDFTKLIYNEKFAKAYVDVLLKEISSYKLRKLDTIYIGGGTPTSLDDADFERILAFVSPMLESDAEFSVEANVENLTKEKLLLMRKYGVNRLSIGIESTNDEILKSINRHHSWMDAKDVVNLAKEVGFDNINVDLIYGLPGESKSLLIKDLNNILSLDVNHISIYSLIVSKGTMFYNRKIKELDEDTSREYYDLILKTLREHGYQRYEISNFAKNKAYSRHNLVYWHNKPYVGVGLGASGFVNYQRYTNTKNLTEYLKGHFYGYKEDIDEKIELIEYLLTNVRLEEGFLLSDFKSRFGVDFTSRFKTLNEQLIKSGHLHIKKRAHLTDDGLMILDHILLKYFKYI